MNNNALFDVFDNGIVRIALIGVLSILALFLLSQTIITAGNFGRPGNPATDTITVQGTGQATLPRMSLAFPSRYKTLRRPLQQRKRRRPNKQMKHSIL